MNTEGRAKIGYVYILEVKDIVLPVCKIGMTSRHPEVRCAEINNSSTGDFLWEVFSFFPVGDCQRLESLIHKKLSPLRQKRREFFNLTPEDADTAVKSIINNQSEINLIEIEEPESLKPQLIPNRPKIKKSSSRLKGEKDKQYAEVLLEFTSLLGVKGRPFGQLNKPTFGVSDGNEGVQWNLIVHPYENEIKLGVNLEGLKYQNWPIADFILSELETPTINVLVKDLKSPELVTLCFSRDAWQVNSRPDINEKYIGGQEYILSGITDKHWFAILTEALGCLNPEKKYRGRNKQTVTMATIPKKGSQTRELQVSPHLTIWTNIDITNDVSRNLQKGINLLTPAHQWLSGVLQKGSG